ncbi:golgin subfamily A member 6-like protein 22 [Neocloeon triangulifer]|uniref:golgin subfamily A member 6-like protein 22 n=1 Tax=Neocloeon triangulifer TaxID=2078957 RepID=UPI00286EE99E|nr:golgin subfamily A member 6-like protein 22 [Neocloeon triangulifer]
MDPISLEHQYEMRLSWNKSCLEELNSTRKEILGYEEKEAKWLDEAETPGLEDKVGELRSKNFKCHEFQRRILEEETNLKGIRISETENNYKQVQEKVTWRNKSSTRARIAYLKEKLKIEMEHGSCMTKILKDLTKNLVSVKHNGIQSKSPPSTDLASVNVFLERRLMAKEADLTRLEKQRVRLERSKRAVMNKSAVDDLGSINSSDVESVSEAESHDITPLTKALQENIALTLEKQKLEREIKLVTERNEEKRNRCEKSRTELEELQKKLEQYQNVKVEWSQTKENIQKLIKVISERTEICAALQEKVDKNNEEIHRVKDSIISHQARLANSEFSDEELAKTQEIENQVIKKRQELESVEKKIEDAVVEMNELTEQNLALSAEYEEIRIKNKMKESEIAEKKKKEDDEIKNLKLSIMQLQRETAVKRENIKNLMEYDEELSRKIEEASFEFQQLKESLAKLRSEKQVMQSDRKKIEANIEEVDAIIKKTAEERAELQATVPELEEEIKEKKRVRDELQEQLNAILVDSEKARNLMWQVQESKQAAEEAKEIEAKSSEGVFSWLMGWSNSDQKPAIEFTEK